MKSKVSKKKKHKELQMELETVDNSANKSFIKVQQMREQINDIVSLQNKKSKEF